MKRLFSTIRKIIFLYIDKGIAGLSAQLSYYMLFTFFPVLLLANSVIGNILPEDFSIPLSGVIPSPIRTFAMSYLGEIGSSQHSTKLIFLGAVLTIYSLTRYLRFYRISLKKIYEKSRNLNFISDWILSFFFSLGILLLFYVAVFSVFFTDNLFEALGLSYFSAGIWYILRFVLVSAYAFFVVCSLHYVTCGKKGSFFDFAPGALFSVALWTVVSIVFSYYAREITDYSVVYGSIGNVIMLLVWLNLTNTILLMSSVINICFNKKT